MVDKEQEEEPMEVNRNPTPGTGCGSKPTRPGSEKPGDWSCRDGAWVWVENIGG